MNVLVYASSASPGLSNALRSILSPFYTVQSIIPASLATQPWTASCALLVLTPPDTPPAPLSLSGPAQEAIQEYVDAGGRVLGIGLGVSFLSHRPARDRFDLWDATSSTAIVPESPQVVPALLPLSSILLRTGSVLSGLRPASVSFELTRASSDNEAIRGRWEDVGAIAGIQVPVGFGRAAFWGVSPYIDGTEDTASVYALLQYALKSLGLSVPPETIPDDSPDPLPTIPGHPLPQFLLCPRGRRHIAETVLRRLGLSAGAEAYSVSEVGAIEDREDMFHFHWATTLEHGARLVAEARAFADATPHEAMTPGAPRVVVVLPPDVLPTGELTPRFNAEKYFAMLGEVRGDQVRAADDSWGVGEALFYGEAVTSTQTMLERYVLPFSPHTILPILSPCPCPCSSLKLFNLETPAS
jgi:biotin--protein ligase